MSTHHIDDTTMIMTKTHTRTQTATQHSVRTWVRGKALPIFRFKLVKEFEKASAICVSTDVYFIRLARTRQFIKVFECKVKTRKRERECARLCVFAVAAQVHTRKLVQCLQSTHILRLQTKRPICDWTCARARQLCRCQCIFINTIVWGLYTTDEISFQL